MLVLAFVYACVEAYFLFVNGRCHLKRSMPSLVKKTFSRGSGLGLGLPIIDVSAMKDIQLIITYT